MSDMRLLAQLHDRLNFTVEKSHYDALASLLASTRDIIVNITTKLKTLKNQNEFEMFGQQISNHRSILKNAVTPW